MDITAIIAEYNPFHNGHRYHIEKTKALFPDTNIVCIMSGGFVQRGEPAVASEHERAVWAIKSGVSAVIRMPVYSSFSDGENFAKSGVLIAQKIGAKRLSFGSECGDLTVLSEIADILDQNPPEFKVLFDHFMSQGMNYPTAISKTMQKMYPDKNYSYVLSNPNDTLGILYIRALKGTNIEPVCVKRCDNGYDSTLPHEEYLSASGIRALQKEEAKKFIPNYVYQNYQKIDFETEYSSIALYKLRTIQKEELHKIQDVTEGLENRIKKFADQATTLSELLDMIKTKRYTYSRLKRIVLFALLDITKEKYKKSKKSGFARLLAIKKDNKQLVNYLLSKGISVKYHDLSDSDIFCWEEENKIEDLHAVLLHKTTIRNTIFV